MTKRLAVCALFASASARPLSRAMHRMDAARMPKLNAEQFDFESAAMISAAVTPIVIKSAGATDLSAYGKQVWEAVHKEAGLLASKNEVLKTYLSGAVIAHESITSSLAHVLADKLSGNGILREMIEPVLAETLADPAAVRATLADLLQVVTIDPCAPDLLTVLMHFKGFHALQTHRAAHILWKRGDTASKHIALLLQGRGAAVFGVDLHPEASIGCGVFFDHASGVVIGQTASVGDFCYILHGVTLGSTGRRENGRRHPRVGSSVSIGAGASILGPIHIGNHALIGSLAIVTKTVQDGSTVVGTNKVLNKSEAGAEEFDWLNHWHI